MENQVALAATEVKVLKNAFMKCKKWTLHYCCFQAAWTYQIAHPGSVDQSFAAEWLHLLTDLSPWVFFKPLQVNLTFWFTF